MILSTDLDPAFDARMAGLSVIRQEAEGLIQLAEMLDDRFSEAVTLIVGTRGRLIVAGMGKSGHICRKIAATLSATGSAAYFLHPAEASHGDLGVLQRDDVMLLFSNSGSTPELKPLVDYARNIAVPVVAVVSEPDSWLARHAAIALILPSVPEACPERIAPTTSTTMMLALGDALAVAAMRARGVSRNQLVGWHPGGNIGRDAMPVVALMRRGDPLPLVTPDTGMRDVVIEMTSVGKGVTGVVDHEGDLVGIITDGDLRRAFDRMLTATAGEIMTTHPKTVLTSATVAEARQIMIEAKITVMFVVEADSPRKLTGVLHIHDLALTSG